MQINGKLVKMNVSTTDWIIDANIFDLKLKGSKFFIFCVLNAIEGSNITVSRPELSRVCRCNRRSVNRNLKELKDDGLLTEEQIKKHIRPPFEIDLSMFE